MNNVQPSRKGLYQRSARVKIAGLQQIGALSC